MAVYKVPQDVEAEDKLIGPFTFRQFVFILIMVGFFYMTFLAWQINPIFIVMPLPFALFFGILGLWPRKDQPVEVYLMALIRFWFKPRKRIWSQEGHVDHVVVTAPKKEEHLYSDGLSRGEVQSRLKRLAEDLDSRGWTSRHVSAQDAAGSYAVAPQPAASDRLITPQNMIARPPEQSDIHSSDDVLDANNNPLAQKFDDLSRASAKKARDQAISQMHAPPAGDSTGDVNYNPYPSMQQSVINPAGQNKPKDKNDHSGMATEPREGNGEQKTGNGKRETAEGGGDRRKQGTRNEGPSQENTSGMTTGPTPAILELSQNSDLNIATLARQAEQAEKALHDEDTIELH